MLVPHVQEKPYNNLNPRIVASLPYRPQRYPMQLFHPDGRDAVISSEEEEKYALEQGFTTTLPARPASASIDIMNHPQTVAEQSAMAEMRRKFDAAYAQLVQRYEALEAENDRLVAENAELKGHRGSKKQAHAEPVA
jgi:hypothetical protein